MRLFPFCILERQCFDTAFLSFTSLVSLRRTNPQSTQRPDGPHGISISPDFGIQLKKEVPLIRAMNVTYGADRMTNYAKMFPDDVLVFTSKTDIGVFLTAPSQKHAEYRKAAGATNGRRCTSPSLCEDQAGYVLCATGRTGRPTIRRGSFP
jgi:hypothetical protein